MQRSGVKQVSREVASQFPELSGVKPEITALGGNGSDRFQLTFRGEAPLPGGRTLKRIVRIVAEADGRILRLTTSR